MSWFDIHGGHGKQYYEYNHGDKYGHDHKRKEYPHPANNNNILASNLKI